MSHGERARIVRHLLAHMVACATLVAGCTIVGVEGEGTSDASLAESETGSDDEFRDRRRHAPWPDTWVWDPSHPPAPHLEPEGHSEGFCPEASTTIIVLTEGDDKLVDATPGACIVALGGDDKVISNAHGPATILAGPGDDKVHGAKGPTLVAGGDGADWIKTRSAADVIFGQDGNDVIDAGPGDDFRLS
jgi:hypothetical protein